MLATWITTQVVFNGLVFGLVTALVAMGVVLIFRSTKVINFAVGNMGLPGTALLVLCTMNYGLPLWLALLISLIVGAAFAAAVELIVVRRLFNAPRVILLVATIGVAQLAQAIILAYPSLDRQRGANYPVLTDAVWDDVAGVRITGPQLTVLIAVPCIAAALAWLLNRTTFGRHVHASADNPELARLSGVSPKTVSTFVWVVGGLLATVSLIMLSGLSGSPIGLENLGPSTLNRALAAAVIAGMVSFPRALVAGIGLGIAESLVKFNFLDQAGLIDLLLFIAVAAAVVVQTRTTGKEDATFSFAPRVQPVPDRLKSVWWIRHLSLLAGGFVFALAVLLPVVVTQPSRHLLFTTVITLAIAAVSLVVVTGWSGQLSLGQMAFAGLGALVAAAAHRGFEMDIGWGETRILDFQMIGWPWLVAVLVGAAFSALVAALVGIGALRVRGLLLAVSTFAFGLAAQQYLYRRPFFSNDRTDSVPFERGVLLGIDLADGRNYYWFCLGVLGLVVLAFGRLRRTGVGRNTIAVRDNPDNASAYTVRGRRVQLTSFAMAGGLAGLGGALLAGALQNVPLTDRVFQVDDSLQLVAMVVIGGLGSVAGAVIGAAWVVGLPAIFPGNDVVPLLTSSMGLLVLLLYFPSGLVQIAYSARDALLGWADQRLPEVTPAPAGAAGAHAAPPSTSGPLSGGNAGRGPTGGPRTSDSPAGGPAPADSESDAAEPNRPDGEPRVGDQHAGGEPGGDRAGRRRRASSASGERAGTVLTVRDLSVRFGGNLAVDKASIDLGDGEVVGLIGTNGAGKSTLLNAIGGYVASTGSVNLLGEDVSGLDAAGRSAVGLGRTFQAANLFPELTVNETLLVALEARERTRFGSTLLALPSSRRRERSRVAEASELIDFLGLGRYSDAYTADLSTGTRRIVELAALLAVDARVLCLDEPTAGVAQRETEAFGPLILEIRRELGAAMIVIEHDMPLIMGISDRVYCLDLGQVIAHGTPDVVRDDPRVVAAYLGTDERAIDRSDQSASSSAPAPGGSR